MWLLGWLPIFCWLLGFFLLLRRGREYREAFLLSALAWGGLVVLFTETLSYFSFLTWGGLLLSWLAATAVLSLLHYRLPTRWRVKVDSPLAGMEGMEKWLLGGVALIAIATFVSAMLCPPNDWDSMTYHMSRVMHWLQNRSVAHYPTHNLRQIDMNPWAEFAITQFQALSGGDRYANLVQWFSMLGSLAGVSLIAAHLGAGRRGQILAVVVAATIPMGILQASNTQNDYVVAFWLVCLIWAGFKFAGDPNPRWAAIIGLSLGLAVLSKGTAYLYAFPFMLWIAFRAVKGGDIRKTLLAAALIVVPFFAINSHHYWRNYEAFGNPLTSGFYKLSNERISPSILASNAFRNIALELSTPSKSINDVIKSAVSGLHECFGLNVDAYESTWANIKFKISSSWRDELFAGNILHTLLVLLVLPLLIFDKSIRNDRPIIIYSLLVFSGFLLFCLLLKWQMWHNRLLLPLLVLGAPVLGVVAERYRRRGAAVGIAFLLLTAALPYAFSSRGRPLVLVSNDENGTRLSFPLLTMARHDLYFVYAPGLHGEFLRIADEIRNSQVTAVGLIMDWDSWEYPLWMLVNNGDRDPVKIMHEHVGNASRSLQKEGEDPNYTVRILGHSSPVP